MPSLQTDTMQKLGAEMRSIRRSLVCIFTLKKMLPHLEKEEERLTDQPPCRSLDAIHPWNISVFQELNNQVSHKALISSKDKTDSFSPFAQQITFVHITIP